MTNAQIIMSNRVFLMQEGIIKATDAVMTITDDDGTRTINVPEEIHTFNEWKKAGRMVQKGQHAVAKFQIWMPRKNKKADAAEEAQADAGADDKAMEAKGFYKKVAYFFTAEQTKEIGA